MWAKRSVSRQPVSSACTREERNPQATGPQPPHVGGTNDPRKPEESKGFKLLGHDRSAAWGGGSIVEVHKGYAYVGAVGGASYNGPEGFTAHDVRDPRKPKKVYEFRAPPGVHCHKLRVVGDHLL